MDVGNNRRYKVTKKESSKIGWHKTEETGVHDWEGYIRVPEDGTYNFTIQIDDNGYLEINGEKVAELTGLHSSTSVSGSKELKKGFHYAKLHHENLAVPEEIAPYPNAEEFVPKMGNSELELWEIDAPKNLWNIANAQRLLGCYNVVDYPTMTTDDVWNYIGGWLNDSYVSGDANYINNCALRLSIALSSYGIDLNGAPGANNIGAKGNSLALGVKSTLSSAQLKWRFISVPCWGLLIIRMMEKMGTTLPRLEILSYLAIVCMWECVREITLAWAVLFPAPCGCSKDRHWMINN